MIVPSPEESRQAQMSSCPEFLWQVVMWGIEMKGWTIRCGGKGLGVVFSDFHPSSTFPRGGGFLSLCGLDGKCHGPST